MDRKPIWEVFGSYRVGLIGEGGKICGGGGPGSASGSGGGKEGGRRLTVVGKPGKGWALEWKKSSMQQLFVTYMGSIQVREAFNCCIENFLGWRQLKFSGWM